MKAQDVRRIRVLSPDVVDRIAAGEVLDRPANLIKELVENSLDAGSDRIDVEFGEGGRSVCVRDNGRGIAEEDLLVSLQRHATSKIVESEDLFGLSSFGFRGEALASIAAVSDLTLTSRVRGGGQAYRVKSRFGKAEPLAAVSAPEGTEVRVADLFENVPARLKFLKSEAAEHGQIKNTLKALALANENVTFSVRLKNELIYHWPAEDFESRAKAVLGQEKLFHASAEHHGVRVDAMFSSPQDTMNVNRNMWFFVQGRWIQDRSLSAAVMEAYRNLLMHGEYPTVAVRLSLNPEDVDVNVHPTKSAVKFRDSQSVFRAVRRTLRDVLEQAPWLGERGADRVPSFDFDSVPEASPLNVEPQTLSFQSAEFQRTQYSTKQFPLAQVREVSTAYREPAKAAVTDADSVSNHGFKWSQLHVIGQLNQTYIVAQDQSGMYLVDQHAAHERVVFERLMRSFRSKTIEVQTLLIPLVFDFSAEEVEVLVDHAERAESLGLTIERMGPESIAVQAIPMIVAESSVSEALRKLAHELVSHSGSEAFESAIGEIFASMACHSVIRAGQPQSPEQMKSLLVQMDEFPLSSFCPHGRPVFVRRSFSEIEREFGRIV